jgi:putative membrane protein
MSVDIAGAGGFWLVAFLGFALWIAFVVLLVVLLVLAIRWLLHQLNASSGGGQAASVETQDTALATLRERFARGEIDADEYEQRRRTLGG